MSSLYKRHSLLWLSERGWLDAAATLPDAQREHVQRWQTHDWPAVVRRQDADCPAELICLGVALPPDAEGNKLRLPVRVALSQVRGMREPLEIPDVVPHAPASWRNALQQLDRDIAAQGLSVKVYGSLALQGLTGQAYLRASSDIDLLFSPSSESQLAAGISLLNHHAQSLPLDGEIAFPNDAAVSWKEWAQAGNHPDNRVLVKRRGDVALVRVADVLATLTAEERRACPA